jgi:hypothetical protein
MNAKTSRQHSSPVLVSCPGDFVRADSASGVGVGPAKGFGRFRVCANVFAQLVSEIGH